MKITDFTPSPKGTALLLLGPPGSRKTTLCTQLPRPCIIECDNNINGPARFTKNSGLKTDVEVKIPLFDTAGKIILPGARWDRTCLLTNEAINSPDFDTVVVDSLTTLVDFALDKIRVVQGRGAPTEANPIGGALQIQDWGAFATLMKHFIVTTKASGKLIVFTGHVMTDKDELGGYLKQFIACPGQLKETIAGYFDDCWILSMEEDKGVYTNMLRTVPALRQDALGLKTSLGLLPKQPVDYNKINELLMK